MTASSLDVWLDDRVVARLGSDRGELTLRYAPEVARELGEGALCLSVALPVQAHAYRSEPVRWWVEGLLPEGESRTYLEQRYEIARGDSFGLIAAIGRDCAGAVSFLVPGEQPVVGGDLRTLTESELARAIADLPTAPLGNDDEVRVSLGGLQAKLLLCRTTDGWARPVGGAPSTHILKPDSVTYPGLVATEGFALSLARASGLASASAELVSIDGRDVLVVERFDRARVGGLVRRLHQEDGCQSLGIDPNGQSKYERRPGPPSYETLARILVDHGLDPLAHLASLARKMTFTVSIGDADGHARNHAFFVADGAVEPAPIYDVAPTVEFARSTKLALRVGGLEQIDDVTRAHLRVEAASWGLGETAAIDAIDSTVDAMLASLDTIDPGAIDPELVGRMKARIERVGHSSRR